MHLLKKKAYIELGRVAKKTYQEKYNIIRQILFMMNEYAPLDVEGLSIHLDMELDDIHLLSEEDKYHIARSYLQILSSDEIYDIYKIEQALNRRALFITYLQMICFEAEKQWISQLEEEEREVLIQDIESYIEKYPETATLLKIGKKEQQKNRHCISLK